MPFPDDLENWLFNKKFVKTHSLHPWNPWKHEKVQVIPVKLSHISNHVLQPGFQLQVLEESASTHTVFVWEDRWQHQKGIILSRLEAFLNISFKIHGRQTEVVTVSKIDMQEFMDTNHLLGFTGGRYNFGLVWKGELVAAAIFGRGVNINREFGPSVSHELTRFCYKSGVHVRGGLSKLLHHFIREFSPGDIYTAVDREWSKGAGFKQLGFKTTGFTPPLTFWIDSNGKRHRTEMTGAIKVCNAGNVKLMLRP
jgi:hypothetical protein